MKNLLLFSALLLSSASIFAQLTVKPTLTGADSYVYVNDQVLFVNQDINLTRNDGSATAEANIYLRNNAQLMQGDAGSDNYGSGQVSVQQNSPATNAWAYYYWCSPIGSPGPTGTPRPAGNQYFGVSQIFEPIGINTTTAVRSSTTTGQNGTITPVTISTRWLYTHPDPGTEAAADYIRMNTGNNAPPGFGFIMKGVGTIQAPVQLDQTYEFRGRPNNGNFTIPVEDGLMTLSGNPYPSALDLNKLFYDNGNEELGELFYYDEDRTVASHYYSNKPYGYGVWTPGSQDLDGDPYNGSHPGIYTAAEFFIWNAGGTHGGTQGTGNLVNDKRFAPIGQGIMFVGNSTVGDGFVNIRNSQRLFYRENLSGSIFQRPGATDANTLESTLGNNNNNDDNGGNDGNDGIEDTILDDVPVSIIDNRTPQMRIWTIFDEAVTRDMVLAFYDKATDGYDRGLDGKHPMTIMESNNTDAYFPVGYDIATRKPYVINAVKYDFEKRIPIAFKIKNQIKFVVKVVEEVKKPYEIAYLFDRLENTYQQINNEQGATFELNAGIYEDRFFVVFRNPNLKNDTPLAEVEEKNTVLERVTFFQNNPIKQLELQNPDGYTLKSAAVYDMNGKLVINEKNLGDNNRYSFYTGNLSDGVYLVKLTTSNDIIIDYKAIVHNR